MIENITFRIAGLNKSSSTANGLIMTNSSDENLP
jgi:hypothetical protein